ncbi:hypothetical protein SNEBB_001931, partial [Seison nebaliae]
PGEDLSGRQPGDGLGGRGARYPGEDLSGRQPGDGLGGRGARYPGEDLSGRQPGDGLGGRHPGDGLSGRGARYPGDGLDGRDGRYPGDSIERGSLGKGPYDQGQRLLDGRQPDDGLGGRDGLHYQMPKPLNVPDKSSVPGIGDDDLQKLLSDAGVSKEYDPNANIQLQPLAEGYGDDGKGPGFHPPSDQMPMNQYLNEIGEPIPRSDGYSSDLIDDDDGLSKSEAKKSLEKLLEKLQPDQGFDHVLIERYILDYVMPEAEYLYLPYTLQYKNVINVLERERRVNKESIQQQDMWQTTTRKSYETSSKKSGQMVRQRVPLSAAQMPMNELDETQKFFNENTFDDILSAIVQQPNAQPQNIKTKVNLLHESSNPEDDTSIKTMNMSNWNDILSYFDNDITEQIFPNKFNVTLDEYTKQLHNSTNTSDTIIQPINNNLMNQTSELTTTKINGALPDSLTGESSSNEIAHFSQLPMDQIESNEMKEGDNSKRGENVSGYYIDANNDQIINLQRQQEHALRMNSINKKTLNSVSQQGDNNPFNDTTPVDLAANIANVSSTIIENRSTFLHNNEKLTMWREHQLRAPRADTKFGPYRLVQRIIRTRITRTTRPSKSNLKPLSVKDSITIHRTRTIMNPSSCYAFPRFQRDDTN